MFNCAEPIGYRLSIYILNILFCFFVSSFSQLIVVVAAAVWCVPVRSRARDFYFVFVADVLFLLIFFCISISKPKSNNIYKLCCALDFWNQNAHKSYIHFQHLKIGKVSIETIKLELQIFSVCVAVDWCGYIVSHKSISNGLQKH